MDNYAVRDYYGGFSIMKITKILGAASAAVVSAAVMAASAGAYEAFLMYASSDWSVQCMEATLMYSKILPSREGSSPAAGTP